MKIFYPLLFCFFSQNCRLHNSSVKTRFLESTTYKQLHHFLVDEFKTSAGCCAASGEKQETIDVTETEDNGHMVRQTTHTCAS